MVVSHNQGVAFNVLAYGAQGYPNDDTAAILAAVSACATSSQLGGTVLLPLRHAISGPIPLPSNVELVGLGRQSALLGLPNFSGAALVTASQANYCAVRMIQLGFLSASMATNPSADGIQITSSKYFSVTDVDFINLNGYCLEILGSATLSPNASLGAMVRNIHALNCNGGIHTLGVTAASFAVQAWLSDLNLETIVGPLDAILLEDSQDILIENVNGAVGQNSLTNSFFHVKGRTSAFISNPDCGVFPGPNNAPTMLIEDSSNGSPKAVKLSNGIIQQGTNCLSLTGAAADVTFSNIKFSRAQSHGVLTAGTVNEIAFVGCTFDVNNQGAASNIYDVNSGSTNNIRVIGSSFNSAIGSAAGQVQQNINVSAGSVWAVDNFTAAGSIANFLHGSAKMDRNNANHNPVGFLSSQPSIGGSPWTTPVQPTDCMVLVTGGTVSSITLAGTSTGLTSGWFFVPAGESLVITYSVIPTSVQWWGN